MAKTAAIAALVVGVAVAAVAADAASFTYPRRPPGGVAFGSRGLSDPTQTPLREGQVQGPYDIETANDFTYFAFEIPAGTAKGCVITLTPLEGDPDMFISRERNEPTNPQNSQWYSTRTHMDVVTINPQDEGNCNEAEQCTYHIGVKAYNGPASFTIVAELDEGEAIQLVDGQPQYGDLPEGRYNNYEFTVPADAARVEIAIMPYFGDPDLYVNVGTSPQNPTRGHAQYSSLTSDGEDMIRLDRTDDNFAQCQDAADPCKIRVAVHGFVETSYQLVVTSNDQHTMLVDGLPTTSTVGAWEYEYFSFTTARTEAPVYITLTPFSGDPDMFVTNEAHTHRPTAQRFDWESLTTDLDQVVIEANDPKKGCVRVCEYFIGVRGFATNSSFSILAYVPDGTMPINLFDGIQQRGTVAPGQVTYYQFHQGSTPTDIEFVATTLSGQVQMYVSDELDISTGLTRRPTVTCATPPVWGMPCTDIQAAHYNWDSLLSNSRARVSVSHYDRMYQTSRVYVIAVYGVEFSADNDANIEFSISAVTSANVLTLSQGLPTEDHVDEGQYRYYRMLIDVLPPVADVQLTLTSFSGDADLYVSETVQRPSRDTGFYTWRAFGTSQSETITIQDQHLTTCATRIAAGQRCELWIAVYGWRNASYSLLGSVTDGAPIVLLDGVPQHGSVPRQQYAYYSVSIPAGANSPITITVSPDQGDPDLYIQMTPGARASKDSYTYKAAMPGADSITINPTDDAYCSGCDISVAVYGYGTDETSFILTYSTEASTTTLLDSVPQLGFAQASTYQYFTFHTNDPNAAVHITLTPLSGDPDLVVMQEDSSKPADERFPTLSANTWSSMNFGADVIVISKNDPHFCYNCNYLIGVYAFTNTSFMLSATASATPVVNLVNGVPQTGDVATGEYAYFKYSQMSGTVEITIDEIDANVEAYVTNQYYGQGDAHHGALPTRESSVWSTTGAHQAGLPRGMIHISTNDAHWDEHHTEYTIGVYGVQGGSFRITAKNQGVNPTQISVGVPVTNQFVASGQMQQYSFTLDTNDKDLQVTLSSLDGDPDMIMTTRGVTSADLPECHTVGTHASCSNYMWGEFSQGSGSITLSHVDPCNGAIGVDPPCSASTDYTAGTTFHIGVYGYTDAHFNLLVGFAGQRSYLVEGEPQQVTSTVQPLCEQRNANTEECTGDMDKYVFAQTSFLTFSITPEADRGDITLQVDRLCGADTLSCDTTMHVYVSACSAGACTAEDRYPSPDHNQFAFTMGANNEYFTLPQTHSYCDDTTVTCNFYVTATPAPDQVNCRVDHCAPQTLSIIMSTETGVESISHNCVDGHLCHVPLATLMPNQVKNYEVFMGPGNPASCDFLFVKVRACTGYPKLYVCWNNADSNCTDPYNPSAEGNNYDRMLDTKSEDRGYSLWHSPCTWGTWFLSAYPNSDSQLPQEFEVEVASGKNYLELVADRWTLQIGEEGEGGTDYNPRWEAAFLQNYNGLHEDTKGPVEYEVWAVPKQTIQDDTILWTPCGIRSTRDGRRMATTNDLTVDLGQTLFEEEYWINVIAVCGDGCMPKGEKPQEYAYHPRDMTQVVPDFGGGLGGGWVFLIIVLVLGVVGGGVWFMRKRMSGPARKRGPQVEGSDAEMAYYAPM